MYSPNCKERYFLVKNFTMSKLISFLNRIEQKLMVIRIFQYSCINTIYKIINK